MGGSAPKKGVGSSLPSDGGVGAVARVYPDVIAQGEDLRDHALDQLMVIATGKIGPSNGPREEGVPGEHGAGRVKTDASRRVTRRVDDR